MEADLRKGDDLEHRKCNSGRGKMACIGQNEIEKEGKGSMCCITQEHELGGIFSLNMGSAAKPF